MGEVILDFPDVAGSIVGFSNAEEGGGREKSQWHGKKMRHTAGTGLDEVNGRKPDSPLKCIQPC